MTTPPDLPIGPMPTSTTPAERPALIDALASAPEDLRRSVQGLDDPQLDTRYRNWTVRQIVHHLPDSHVNCYVRFMLALTEHTPVVRPYDEATWSDLAISKRGDISTPLLLMEAVHGSWVALLKSMSDADFERAFHHPELAADVTLADALAHYVWHGRHHVGQIHWLRAHHGWS